MPNKIDHIAIGAKDLDQGTAWLKDQLGATIPRGGKHPAMSTHNCVAQSGNSSFLELISIDPDAPADPGRTRWFTLDDPQTQAKLVQNPRALCWVVNTDDLDAVIANSPVDLGEVLELNRGDLSWRLTVPQDGSLAEGGLLPAFIEWSMDEHPSGNMQDVGITLEKIKLKHPTPIAFSVLLEQLNIDHLVELGFGEEHSLSFVINTPDGKQIEIS